MVARSQQHRGRRGPRRSFGAAAALALAAVVGLAANQMTAAADQTAGGHSSSAADRGRAAGQALAAQVTVDGVLSHLRAFQQIADNAGWTRMAGPGKGYPRSVDHVADALRGAGYQVTRQRFDYPYFEERHPTKFRRISPAPKRFRSPGDFRVLSYAGAGTVEAPVHAVDVDLTPPRRSTSGCEAADFTGFPAGAIALIQRGTCEFRAKVRNAMAARASAVIIFNQGDGTPAKTKEQFDAFGGTLQSPVRIPAISVSYAIGADLATAERARVRIETDTSSETRTTENLLAELPARSGDRTVMVGAHLDSVPEGPGINDNGSGSAGILEVALRYAELVRTAPTTIGSAPVNSVRFAWWGAEEFGLLGSQHYVEHLTAAERRAIALYLNFDMIGSPNYQLAVYDGDNSNRTTGTGRTPAGSAQIEKFLRSFLAERGQKSVPSPFNGRSDYRPFIADDIGIPAGGMETGADDIKPASAVAKFGGVAGIASDPCYHQACDSLTTKHRDRAKRAAYRKLRAAYGNRLIGNINVVPLDVISDAIAAAVGRYAYDVSDVVGAPASPAP